jgi:hypothetical protein
MSDAGSRKARSRLLIAAFAIFAVLLALFVPPLISLAHYKTRITQLMSRALGRPVKISSVEARLLPRPGFEIDNLEVEEDPAFGAEPILHANTVDASLRLLSLWRGKLEISRISLDEASLNLVRTEQGRWNVDALFRSASSTVGQSAGAGGAGTNASKHRFPTIVAKNSRVNFKRGIEKLPYSLTNADLSLSSNGDGSWDVAFKGQPVRTDMIFTSADTGVLEMDATIRNAPELRQMPIKLQAEWKKAQLGQLTKLLLGADAGWRGDLTGDLTIEGTAGDATVKSRLRATNVHRMELATLSPLDFDANCSFDYHASAMRAEKIECDSPLGNGRLRLTGQLQGESDVQPPAAGTELTVELKALPAEASIDILRTLRAGVLPGIEAKGNLNGFLKYSEQSEPTEVVAKGKPAKKPQAQAGPLTGSLTLDGFELTGGALKEPLKFGKIEFLPANPSADKLQSLEAKLPFSAGAATPLEADVHLARTNYSVHLHGPASPERALELVGALGLNGQQKMPVFKGGELSADLEIGGPWIAGFQTSVDRFSGTATLRNTKFTTPLLLSPVEIASANLRFDAKSTAWDAVNFSYGPLKGVGSVNFPICDEPCVSKTPAHFAVSFDHVDAAAVEAAFLGAQESKTLISKLLERLKPNQQQPWPALEGSIKASGMTLNTVEFTEPRATLHLEGTTASVDDFDAQLLGGSLHLTGKYDYNAGKPAYSFEFQLKDAKPTEVGKLLGQSWSGQPGNASGAVSLSGFTGDELVKSAVGNVHFDWKRGAVTAPAGQLPTELEKSFAHIDTWSGEAVAGGGVVRLGANELVSDKMKTRIDATVTLTTPAKISFSTKK